MESDSFATPPHPRSRFRRHWRWLRWFALAGGGFFVLGVVLVAVLWFTTSLPKDLPPLQNSVVLDAKGREIAVFQNNGLRDPVKLDQVSPKVVDALIASEDRHFFDHGGIDPGGIVRALWNDLRGNHLQGGSTITQQLVKNSYLSSDRSLWRKAKEAVLSVKLEQTHDKNDILERYLHTVYFGRGAYGIQAAANVYFNTTAAQLDTNQSALLVGLLSSPETADPAKDPAAAQKRRDRVLDALVETRKLTADEAATVKQQPLGAVPRVDHTQVAAGVAPWFVEYVRQEATAQFGESALYGGGLKITTTLDLDDQKAAEDAIATTLDSPDDPQAALVALDKSGAIRAYVGGRDYNTLKVDLARGKAGGGSGRQAGSTFKPFVLAADAEQGGNVSQRFPAPAHITLPTSSGPWEVSNYNNESFGELDLTEATAHSVNTVYAQLVLQVGPDKAAQLARSAGIMSDLPSGPSITLGTGETSPLELADAYLTFARDGERVEPFAIDKVESSTGATVYQAHPSTVRAMKADTAHLVDFVLQQVIAGGTGTAAKLDRPVAGKTGTTENNADAWFAGYTPDYAAVVWMGYPDGARPMENVHGVATVTGGTLPAKIWRSFMNGALTDVPADKFPDPPEQLLNGSSNASAPPSTDSSTDDTTTTTSTTNPASSTSTSTSTTSPQSTTSTTGTTSTTSPNSTTSTTHPP